MNIHIPALFAAVHRSWRLKGELQPLLTGCRLCSIKGPSSRIFSWANLYRGQRVSQWCLPSARRILQRIYPPFPRAQKGGFFKDAASEGLAILFPDTSPRGAGVEGEDDDWDFGTSAGFYLDATNPKYAKNYNMHKHVTQELPQILESAGLPVDLSRKSVFGHSMGGHGALTIYLHAPPGTYRSVSAFAPISNPTECPWGHKAFNGYLAGGIDEARGRYDATELIRRVKEPVHILIDFVGISLKKTLSVYVDKAFE